MSTATSAATATAPAGPDASLGRRMWVRLGGPKCLFGAGPEGEYILAGDDAELPLLHGGKGREAPVYFARELPLLEALTPQQRRGHHQIRRAVLLRMPDHAWYGLEDYWSTPKHRYMEPGLAEQLGKTAEKYSHGEIYTVLLHLYNVGLVSCWSTSGVLSFRVLPPHQRRQTMSR